MWSTRDLVVQAQAHHRGTIDVGFLSISDFGGQVLILKRFQKRLDSDLSYSLRDVSFFLCQVYLPLAELLTAIGSPAEFVLLLLKFSDSSMGIYVLS